MKIIYLSGIFVALVPFLGIPYSWKTLLLVILGLIIFIKGYLRDRKSRKEVKQLEASFEQNEQPEKLKETINKETSTSDSFQKNVSTEEVEDTKKQEPIKNSDY